MSVIRKTKSVNTIVNYFDKSKQAISVVDLVDMLKKEMNKSTVYRILDRLEHDGIIHSFLGKSGIKWYAKCTGCSSEKHIDVHPHFQCQECGAVECISIDVTIPTIANYQINSAQLLLLGSCRNCI
ncbi:Zinc uptake regulation protein ZUR [Tenacibaculum sp. 190524A02b]|uniref:Transcriptional regulator n=1 Tax=Tenacibaculum vairaonense TaxID=3137860 RepID=A0ABM9PPJ5_9FLAO